MLSTFVAMQITTPSSFIPAAPNSVAQRFWGAWFKQTMRRHFHKGLMKGAEHVRPWTGDGRRRSSVPLILYATHGSWWDAALSIVLSVPVLDLRSYGMMEYKQLSRYRFFRQVGMFSVIREDPGSAMRSIRYATDVLRGTGNSLFMFPQGTLVNQERRPIECEPGIGILARALEDVWLCPVAYRYELLREQRGEVRVVFGTPHRETWSEGRSIRALVRECSDRLSNLADVAREDALNEQHEGYEVFLRGPISMEQRFDRLLGRQLTR